MDSSKPKDSLQNSILSYLIEDAIRKLRKKHKLSKQSKSVASSIQSTIEAFTSLRQELKTTSTFTLMAWHELFLRCHELYGTLGGILTADHWQAPAFGSNGVNEVGDEQRKIIANLNDYKRDQHPMGLLWEHAYAKAFLIHSFMEVPTAFATTSGMAALTVAALVVRQRLPKEYRIAVGEHSYFENHELLHMMFPAERIVLFDERQPASLRAMRPNAIFFDLLANDPSMTVADVSGILSVAARMGHHVDVVVDTACTSMEHFRVPVMTRVTGKVSIIGFESLNKYHQFGLDRTTGGVLWAYGILNDMVYRVRDHAGVIIPESAAATLPTPYRSLHKQYLNRLQHNAMYLAKAMQDISNIRVSYPGLPSHTGHVVAKRVGYFGSFISVEFPGQSWRKYRPVMRSILAVAKKKNVPIVSESSFGMPITRIYTWSPRSQFEKPFLRIAPGLESPEDIARIRGVVIPVLRNCVKEYR